ncbi:MAG: hypothetical protein KGQ49_00525 [Verrucomicrobia bacterium]|nr:hypothetical protein [Verrucomicrobiota bacterium]MBU6445865.1 hypothetical protein [Verrucomicrobiota bacterium]MDE3048162.1 hypothetical protein [Verrucomicrobiota bacterium]
MSIKAATKAAIRDCETLVKDTRDIVACDPKTVKPQDIEQLNERIRNFLCSLKQSLNIKGGVRKAFWDTKQMWELIGEATTQIDSFNRKLPLDIPRILDGWYIRSYSP